MMKNIRKKRVVCLLFLSFVLTVPVNAEHFEGEDCSKCHITHENEEYKLLTPEAINSGKILCFTCHSSNAINGAPDMEQAFTMAQSHHPLGTDKDCLICHNINDRHNDGRLDSWPDIELKDPDPEDSHVYQGGKINNFCLSCHDNSPVTLGDPPRIPIDLSSAYEFTGHGRIDIDEACDSCHEHHASFSKPFLIKDVINNEVITGNDNSVCFACHTEAEGSYAGKMTYQSSEHGMQDKFCIDCHNPHGDSKDLCYLCHNDQYSTHYSTKRDKLCIDCHNPHQKDGLKMTNEDEEKLCFQCHKELEREFGNLRDGIAGSFSHHKVDDEEYRGGKVECFDCHNPHVVTKFNIVSLSGTSGYGMPPQAFPTDAYDQQTDIYDGFCLSCHDGSKFSAKNINSELSSESNLESDFTADGDNNLHKAHKEQGFGCQNCHDAHSSQGTRGIKRGALLREDITVNNWDQMNKYYQGKNSCSSFNSSLGCH